MAKFGAMWIGGPLTKIQETSLASFVYYGHDINLFVYDMSLSVPYGVKKMDAREVMLEEESFLVDGTYAAFSDLFRYKMIQKFDLIWVDADVICLDKDWTFKDDIIVGREKTDTSDITGSVLKLPKDSEALKYMIDIAFNFDRSQIKWSEVGPFLVTDAFERFNYLEHVQPYTTFSGISWFEWKKLWEPDFKDEVVNFNKIRGTKSISVYNHTCTMNNIDKNNLPDGSAIQYFYNKFVLRKE